MKSLKIIFFILFLFSCRKEKENTPPEITDPYEQFIIQVAMNEIQLRGVMLILAGDDMKTAREELTRLRNNYGANHVRLVFFPNLGLTIEERNLYKLNLEGPEWYKTSIKILRERWFPVFKELGLPVIINLNPTFNTIGPVQDVHADLWTDKETQDKFVSHVVNVAKCLQYDDIIIGYDLLNEPIPPGCRCCPWTWDPELAKSDGTGGDTILCHLYNRAITEIRKFDKRRLIAIQPGPWGLPVAFPALLNIVDDPRLIFEFHLYEPGPFCKTCADAYKSKDINLIDTTNKNYPSTKFSKSNISEYLDVGRNFQLQRETVTGKPCPIWIGEFGVTRVADSQSAQHWFEDSIDLMELYRWSWAYFVYNAGINKFQDHYGQNGYEGVDPFEYIQAFINNDMEYYENTQDTLRQGFRVLINHMKSKNQYPGLP